MRVVSKFKLSDGTLGYVLDDGGLEYPVTERGLYDGDILEGLISEGYKILNYHGDITSPNGSSIKDLVESPCTATEDEIQTMLDMADYALSEAEASRYFSRDVEVKEIEFKAPNVKIKTREELVAYLNKCKRMSRYTASMNDVVPLNSFVAREALFTLDEIARDKEVRDLFTVIENRRKLQSYSAYKYLIKFLQSEGVLGESYTADDIKTAYLSWGICGIKTPVVDMRTKIGVTTDILERLENRDRRVPELCLLDKQGIIHYSGGEVDLSECTDFSQEIVQPFKEEAYYDSLRSTSKWESEYWPIKCNVTKFNTRTYFELLDENGVTYSARVDNDRLIIFDVRNVVHTAGFLFVRCIDGSFAPIDQVYNHDMYQKWNLAMAKARDLVRAKTVVSPINNSFELLLSEGVSPEAAVRYIARRISDDKVLNAEHQTGIDYADAYAIYRNGPSKELIKKYNPNDYEYTNLDSLIEIMCATRDEMEERGEYLLVSKDDMGRNAEAIREEIRFRPIENLEFVKLVKEGNVSVDNLFRGKMQDGLAETDTIAKLIDLTVKMETGRRNVSASEYSMHVRNIEESDVINIDSIIKVRDAAYRGYLKDRAVLNATRATQATSLVYVTRVFREMANTKADTQRHYMFECISIPVYAKSNEEKYLMEISNAIKTSLNGVTGLKKQILDILAIEAPSFAAKLMFKIVTGNIKVAGTTVDDNMTTIVEEWKVSNREKVTLNIKVNSNIVTKLRSNPEYLQRKYCTLNDWCDYEMTANWAFNFYCINANITPWEVKPKAGFSIQSYNFCLNYIKPVVLNNFSEAFRNKVTNEKAKVAVIADTYFDNSLLDGVVDDELFEYTLDTIDGVLSHMAEETVSCYYKRFTLHNNDAKAHGKYLQSMRLKSDESFGNYSDIWFADPVDEDVYQELVNKSDASMFLSETTPMLISDKVSESVAIEGGNIIEQFNFNDQRFDDVARWSELVAGTFEPKAICIYSVGNLLIITQNKRLTLDLRTLSRENANKLVNKGIFYQLNATKYLVSTSNGYITVEVR